MNEVDENVITNKNTIAKITIKKPKFVLEDSSDIYHISIIEEGETSTCHIFNISREVLKRVQNDIKENKTFIMRKYHQNDHVSIEITLLQNCFKFIRYHGFTPIAKISTSPDDVENVKKIFLEA